MTTNSKANEKMLETERLILRPWREEDAASLYKYAQNPNVGPMAGWLPHTSVENSRELIRTVLQDSYAVVLKETGEPVGSIGLKIGSESAIAIPDTEAELGYWIGEPFWGQGLIPEAAKVIMDYGFTDLELQRLWCGYFVDNQKSRRVQEKCGFGYRYTEEKRYCSLLDEYRDENMNRITLKEWKNPGAERSCDAVAPEDRLVLYKNGDALTLRKGNEEMHVDFGNFLRRIDPVNLNSEPLIKAAKLKDKTNPRAIDATAGLGEDSLILAAHGFDVKLYERDPVIGSLLMDGIRRGKEREELREIIDRMEVVIGDSVAAMDKMEADERPHVVLLDPMFPKRNKSGLVKKKFQLIHQLEDPCDNEEELVNAAIKAASDKIVIKRPAKGPYLAGKKPTYSIQGSTIRWDCIQNS